MTTILTEKTTTGELVFEFSDKWKTCQYDEQPFYNTIRYKGFKGVDFIASSGNGVLLMEVKYVVASNEASTLRFTNDADNDKIKEIKSQLTSDQQKRVVIKSARPYLVDEVTQKVKDTVLGLFSCHRNKDVSLSLYAQSLFSSDNQPILILLFLERNTVLNQEENFKPLASHLKLAIEQKLSFLGNIQVSVVNTLTLPSELEIKASSPKPV